MTRPPGRGPRPGAPRGGFTLVEVMVVVTLIGILSTISALSFPRAVEQARADLAAANLQSIQAAQRFYRLGHPGYAPSLAELRAEGLVDRAVLSPDDPPELRAAHAPSYLYSIDPDNPLIIRAARASAALVDGTGVLTIDQDGYVSGEIRLASYPAGIPAVRPARIFSHQDL